MAYLKDAWTFTDAFENRQGQFRAGNELITVSHFILASDVPGVFNLGGDLHHFMTLIKARDRAGLQQYGESCIRLFHKNYEKHSLPLTTIALVQGECLGGGFEIALSCDLIVAEQQARFGFPEILFNLFPGMGAYSVLKRLVGIKKTEDLLTSGKVYTAQEMFDLGIIDAIVANGEGVEAVNTLIKKRSASANGLTPILSIRRMIDPISYGELHRIVTLWVETALSLSERDLRKMARLVARQDSLSR